MQYYCGLRDSIHKELKGALPVIPLVNDSEGLLSSSSPQLISLEEHISREEHITLQNRVRALEIFLREYVVDVHCLETLMGRDDPVTSIDSETTETNSSADESDQLLL